MDTDTTGLTTITESGTTETTKKKKLTKAEKKALQVRLKKLEKRQAAEAARQVIRDELQREDTYGERNRNKLEKKWRQMLLDIKTPVLKKEFTYAVNNMERLIDAKDYIISLSMDAVDIALEQESLNLKTHLENVSRIISIFHDRLRIIKENFDSKLNELFQMRDNLFNSLANRRENDEDYLNMMIYGLELENKNDTKNVRGDYMSKISAENKRYDQIHVLKKYELQNIFETMWSQYKEEIKKFLDSTSERKKEFDKLRERDSFMRKIMEEQVKSIVKYYEDIQTEKNLQVYQRSLIEDAERDLYEETKCFGDAFHVLKSKLIADNKTDNSQLIVLTEISNNVLKQMDETKLKGEKILRFITLCRKYETEFEKVLPFPDPKENGTTTIEKKFPVLKALLNIDIMEIKGLDNFWQKCGQADATRHLLIEEKQYLQRENLHLKNALKKYCKKNACRCISFPNISRIPSKECVILYKNPK